MATAVSRRFFTFRLPALFVVMAILAAGLAWRGQPQRKEVTAYLGFHRPTPMTADGLDAQDEKEFEQFRLSQPAIVRSPLVLGAVVADAKVAKSQVLKSQADPAQFIADRLEISFPSDELMAISMAGTKGEVADLREIVNAVAKTYLSLHREDQNKRLQRILSLLQMQEERHEQRIKEVFEQLRVLRKHSVEGKNSIDLNFAEAELEREKWLFDQVAQRRMIFQLQLSAPDSVSLRMEATAPAFP